MSISRAPWCLHWVSVEVLGEFTLRPESQSWLWTVRFSVLIWIWASCHFGECSSVEHSTLMVQRRWKPACQCWSGFAQQVVEERGKTAETWLAHDAAAATWGSLATTCCEPCTWGVPPCMKCALSLAASANGVAEAWRCYDTLPGEPREPERFGRAGVCRLWKRVRRTATSCNSRASKMRCCRRLFWQSRSTALREHIGGRERGTCTHWRRRWRVCQTADGRRWQRRVTLCALKPAANNLQRRQRSGWRRTVAVELSQRQRCRTCQRSAASRLVGRTSASQRQCSCWVGRRLPSCLQRPWRNTTECRRRTGGILVA